MGIDHAVAYGAALKALIPDEPVLAATVTKRSIGLEVEPLQEEDFGGSEITVASVVAAATLALFTYTPSSNWMGWMAFGRASQGNGQSVAAQLCHVTRSALQLLVAVTPEWIYFFRQLDSVGFIYQDPARVKAPGERLELLVRLDRKAVRSAKAGWYRLNPGRLTLTFVDGSWVAFADSIHMGRRRAKRLAAVLG